MAQYQVLYWQAVPSLVKAFAADGTELKRQLPDFFQQEIDRLAMTEGLTGTDAYLEQWHWGEIAERPGSASDVLDAVVRELEHERA
jgi:cvfA/B/C family virulence factor